MKSAAGAPSIGGPADETGSHGPARPMAAGPWPSAAGYCGLEDGMAPLLPGELLGMVLLPAPLLPGELLGMVLLPAPLLPGDMLGMAPLVPASGDELVAAPLVLVSGEALVAAPLVLVSGEALVAAPLVLVSGEALVAAPLVLEPLVVPLEEPMDEPLVEVSGDALVAAPLVLPLDPTLELPLPCVAWPVMVESLLVLAPELLPPVARPSAGSPHPSRAAAAKVAR